MICLHRRIVGQAGRKTPSDMRAGEREDGRRRASRGADRRVPAQRRAQPEGDDLCAVLCRGIAGRRRHPGDGGRRAGDRTVVINHAGRPGDAVFREPGRGGAWCAGVRWLGGPAWRARHAGDLHRRVRPDSDRERDGRDFPGIAVAPLRRRGGAGGRGALFPRARRRQHATGAAGDAVECVVGILSARRADRRPSSTDGSSPPTAGR